MKLLRNDTLQVYVWVDEKDEKVEYSPHFDYEEDADVWYRRLVKEVTKNCVCNTDDWK